MIFCEKDPHIDNRYFNKLDQGTWLMPRPTARTNWENSQTRYTPLKEGYKAFTLESFRQGILCWFLRYTQLAGRGSLKFLAVFQKNTHLLKKVIKPLHLSHLYKEYSNGS